MKRGVMTPTSNLNHINASQFDTRSIFLNTLTSLTNYFSVCPSNGLQCIKVNTPSVRTEWAEVHVWVRVMKMPFLQVHEHFCVPYRKGESGKPEQK